MYKRQVNNLSESAERNDIDNFSLYNITDSIIGGEYVPCLLYTSAEDFGGDPERIYLCGDSAGAYLCVYLAAMQRNPDVAKVAKVPKIVPEIKALGLISGMFYIHKPDNIGFFMPKLVYGKNWKKEPFAPYTDPENPGIAGKGNLPPCFILTAKGDFLRHYSRNFAKALKKNGCEHTLLDIDVYKRQMPDWRNVKKMLNEPSFGYLEPHMKNLK